MTQSAGAVLFALSVVNVFTGVWPRPLILSELLVGLLAMIVMYQGLLMIVFTHRLAPGGTGRRWRWNEFSVRFWLLFLSVLVAPLGLVLLPGVWNQSHAWAITWAICGLVSALLAYLAGRPWNPHLTTTDAEGH